MGPLGPIRGKTASRVRSYFCALSTESGHPYEYTCVPLPCSETTECCQLFRQSPLHTLDRLGPMERDARCSSVHTLVSPTGVDVTRTNPTRIRLRIGPDSRVRFPGPRLDPARPDSRMRISQWSPHRSLSRITSHVSPRRGRSVRNTHENA